MKKLLLVILGLLFCQLSFAKPVDLSTVVNLARNFYYSAMNISYTSKDAPVITSTANYFTGNKLTYYIVNFSNKGYVIVAADDEFYPVPGYSDEANLDIATIPPAMRWWLDMQAADTEKAANQSTIYKKSVHDAWVKYKSSNISKSDPKIEIAPLLTCKWNQDNGYNYHCPEYFSGPGGKCYAGCVATTMAQIMYYYKYPEHGYGSHSYNHVYYGTISEDFSQTTYDWSSMTNILTTLSREAISTLIYHCGVSVNMNYSPLGSGANSYNVAEALISHFNYSNRLKYLEKGQYTNEEWNQMLIDNLELQQPVYYSGAGSSGGHAFVCDGVKDSCYFHFNWGWSGYANGYFYLSNLNSGNGDFSSQQAAVMNITPYFYPYCQGKKEFYLEYKTFNDGSNNSYYWNGTDCDWLIAPDTAERIVLIFNSFATEQGHDFLSIYDGEDNTAPLIGTFSGYNTPPMITSTGNRLYLRFTTDSSGQEQGWSATYSTATAGINSTENEKLTVFPNPASDIVSVSLPTGISDPTVTFYDLTGKLIHVSVSVRNNKLLLIDINTLTNGFYFVKVTGDNKSFTGKVLIQH